MNGFLPYSENHSYSSEMYSIGLFHCLYTYATKHEGGNFAVGITNECSWEHSEPASFNNEYL